MSRTFKILASLISTIILLIFLAIIAVTVWLDPNDYKDNISQLVKEQTGQTLAINGEIHWSFFPSLGIKVENVTLSNPPGFGSQPMAKVGNAEIQMKLLPLLDKRFEMNKLVLQHADINLLSKGNTHSWESMTKSKKIHAAKPVQQKEKQLNNFEISTIDIANTNFSWKNTSTGDNVKLRNVNFQGNNIGTERASSINMSFDLQGLQNVLNMSLDGDIEFNTKKQILDIDDLTLKVTDFKATGSVTGKKIIDNPNITGKLTIKPFNPAKLSREFSQIPNTDVKRASGDLQFDYQNDVLAVNKLDIRLDDTDINGQAKWMNKVNPALSFNVQINTLNLDKLGGNSKKSNKTPAKRANASSTPTKLDGIVKINNLQTNNLKISNVSAKISGNTRITKIAPITASLYRGKAKGQVIINSSYKTPRYSLSQTLSNISVQALLRDLANTSKLSGTMNMSTSLAMAGAGPQGLNGSGQFSIDNGILDGVDIKYEMQRINAFIKKQKEPTAPSNAKTVFSKMSGSFKIARGVISNRDFTMISDSITILGQGTANLVNKQLNYRIQATLTDESQGEELLRWQKNLGGSFPILITGTFDNPKVQPDWQAITTSIIKGQAKKHIEKVLDKSIDGIDKTLEKIKLDKLF